MAELGALLPSAYGVNFRVGDHPTGTGGGPSPRIGRFSGTGIALPEPAYKFRVRDSRFNTKTISYCFLVSSLSSTPAVAEQAAALAGELVLT